MKKYKLALVLLPVLMLSCCKTSSSKEPTFKKFKNQVSYEQFYEDISKTFEGYPLNLTDKFVSFAETMDLSLSSSVAISNNETMTNDYTVNSQRSVNKAQYDCDSNILLFDRQTDSVLTKNDLNYKQGKIALSENNSLSLQLEERNFEDKLSLIAINHEQKGFYNLGDITTEGDDPLNVKALTKDIIYSSLFYYKAFITGYEASTDEEKKNYSFYHDDNVYTVNYLAKGDKEDEYRTVNENDTMKFQVEFTKNKVQLSMKMVNKDVINYKEGYEQYAKKDLVQQETKVLFTSFVELKNVKLKSVDTTTYKYLGNGLSINDIMG